MCTEVHKKGNQWFLKDGTLVGKHIHRNSDRYQSLSVLNMGRFIHYIDAGNNVIKGVYYGYIQDGKFVFLHDGKKVKGKKPGYYIPNP